MLKTVLYSLLVFTTLTRFGDMIFILAKASTNLPIPVIVVTSAMIIYGIVLVFSKFITMVRMKQLLTFYMIQSLMILFNIIYVAMFSPLQISMAETWIVGTFLDLLVNSVLIYASVKRMRSFYLPAPVAKRTMNV